MDAAAATTTTNDGPYQVVVHGAGTGAVNGIYSQHGYIQEACAYRMEGQWDGETVKFCIFKCRKNWYISIIPDGCRPGTIRDIDFFASPISDSCSHVPPHDGWRKNSNGIGIGPFPFLEFLHHNPATAQQQQKQQQQQQQQQAAPETTLGSLLEERIADDIKEIEGLNTIVQNRKQSLQSTIDRMAHSERRENLQRDLDQVGSEGGSKTTECSICQDRDAVLAVIPCGHLCFCDGGCADALVDAASTNSEDDDSAVASCPLCRGSMDGTLKIHGL